MRGLEALPPASEVTQSFLGYGGFPAISTLISLQMFIHAPQSEVHAIGSIDELLKLLRRDPFADFLDAEGGAIRSNGTAWL